MEQIANCFSGHYTGKVEGFMMSIESREKQCLISLQLYILLYMIDVLLVIYEESCFKSILQIFMELSNGKAEIDM